MTKKILHIAQMRVPASGIARQMLEEQKVADSIGVAWHSRLYVPRGCSENSICIESKCERSDKSGFKSSFFNWLESEVKKYDLVLLRHSVYSPGELGFLRKSDKPVYLVHHTLEEMELWSSRGVSGKLLSILERFYGRRSILASQGIVAVTAEIGDYEVARSGAKASPLIYPNGIDMSSVGRRDDSRGGDIPELLFVASEFVPWHGLDLLIESLEKSNEKFVLHLVGKLTAGQADAVAEIDQVVVHGVLSPRDVSNLAARCWVGLGSFALYRKSMYQACTLKVREYLAAGLPVYSGHADVFPDCFPYYKQGPANIVDILDYASSVRGVSRDSVATESRPFIDKGSLLSSLYTQLT